MDSNSVGDRVRDKQNRTNAQRESGLLIISMISDRIGRYEVLLPIYYNYYIKNNTWACVDMEFLFECLTHE